MGTHGSRFLSPSLGLELGALISRRRAELWLALALAAGVHASTAGLRAWRVEQPAAKPLTTRFVKRQPRLAKPLEMKKLPRPRRRQMRRQVVYLVARAQRGERISELKPMQVLARLARPSVDVSRTVGFQAPRRAPQAFAALIEGESEAKHQVDISLEMLDVNALDTGRYHAMVVQDPSDKRNIKGFFRLKYAYSESMHRRDWHHLEDRMMHGLVALLEAMNRYTDIEATLAGRIRFASAELMKTPWVFANITWPFVFPEEEARHFGKYLLDGGFLICDAMAQGGPFYKGGHQRPPVCITSARHNFKTALATQGRECGRHWTFQLLPHEHPIFHCFFDFDGPPGSRWDSEFLLSGELEGVFVHGRWVLVICQKGFQHLWNDPNNPLLRNERMIQFGVNSIIFALTQEGSITRRVMDTVR